MSTYTAQATKAGKYWHVEVPELGVVTQARKVAEIDEMARDLIAIHTDKAPESFSIVTVINLPEEVQQTRQKAEELRQKAAEYNSTAARYNRETVQTLRSQGFSGRDISAALNMSRQRVSQLMAGKTPPEESRKLQNS